MIDVCRLAHAIALKFSVAFQIRDKYYIQWVQRGLGAFVGVLIIHGSLAILCLFITILTDLSSSFDLSWCEIMGTMKLCSSLELRLWQAPSVSEVIFVPALLRTSQLVRATKSRT